MRRHNRNIAKIATLPAANQLAAKKGQFLVIWSEGHGNLNGSLIGPVGAGYRRVMVLRCSKAGVTLFYPPTLTTYRLTLIQWHGAKVETYDPDRLFLLSSIASNARFYIEHNMKFSWKSAHDAMVILVSGLRNTGKVQP